MQTINTKGDTALEGSKSQMPKVFSQNLIVGRHFVYNDGDQSGNENYHTLN